MGAKPKTTQEMDRLIRLSLKTEAHFLAGQIPALRSLSTVNSNFGCHRIAGSSVTITTKPEWGRKLNHTVGFGTSNQPVTQSELFSIERTYLATGLSPELDMCEYADPTAFELLEEEGYEPTGDIDSFYLDLKDDLPNEETGESKVVVEQTNDKREFIELSVDGFLSGGRPRALLNVLAQIAASRQDTRIFLARIDGELVGSAGLAVLDIEDGDATVKTSYLYIDSTLPDFRGQGIHKALLRARLRAARESGCELAVSAARKGSGSARNIERAGLKKIYSTQTYAHART